MEKIVRHTFLLLTVALLVCACDYNDFPAHPDEEVYRYDTVFIPDLSVSTISVRTAVNIGKQLDNQQETSQKYYIAGIVQSFDKKHESAMSDYGNAVFYICDHLSSGVTFEGYQVMSINKAKFASLEQIQIGDTVIICSKITRYNSTIETPGRGVAYIHWTSNLNAYPEKEVAYVEETFSNGLRAWAIQYKQNPGFDVWQQCVAKSGATSAMAWGKDATGNNYESEAWLVSPALNLAAYKPLKAKLAFETYFLREKGKDDASVQPQDMFRLKVSANDGKDWTDITIPTFNNGNAPTPSYDTIDITAYVSANTRVAFAYKSTDAFAPKWNIGNIKVIDRKHSR